MVKKLKNEQIEISEAQPGRFWIHSVELGYGKWISNKELTELVKSK